MSPPHRPIGLFYLQRHSGLVCMEHGRRSRPRNPRLVPYFNRQGQLIGMVRVPPNNYQEVPQSAMHRPSPNNDIPDMDAGLLRASSRRSRSSVSQSVSSTPVNITPQTWDGWPDGQFQCQFLPQQVTDTSQLAIHWVCEALPGHRGSPTALTWQKGKEIHRRCIGVLECSSRSCSFNLQVAPAARGVDLHRQLQKTCLCGEAIRLRSCGIEYSTYLYRGGAFFMNSGNHNHPQYTHSLTYRSREPWEFEEYVVKRPISLSDPLHASYASASSTSSGSDPEWGGIQELNDNSDSSEKTVSDREPDVAPEGESTGQSVDNELKDLDFLAQQELLEDPEADLAED
ncbi:PHD-type domain-containing protein [Mycena venus]|uniref:PHD-type domain-containing protein n=1 Tax=Mycena venus TaxID=2733690 RepID=A0A8H7CVK1_9AGAR|nr:PHD-type domain-containing protein [Mycena venus]